MDCIEDGHVMTFFSIVSSSIERTMVTYIRKFNFVLLVILKKKKRTKPIKLDFEDLMIIFRFDPNGQNKSVFWQEEKLKNT